jgi:type I restriction-modification system DNA methylase subunit/REP element-mobilizing transposase RayT
MAFFQNSVLKKYLNGQDTVVIKAAYQKFKMYFHNPVIQQNIRDAKEEQFQEGFLRELFVEILGYTLNPQPNFNLTTEFKNEKGAKKADAAILSRSHDSMSDKKNKAIAVIELKGTDTKDLDKINIQAFNYKNNQTGCVYVITSNFEKLRFFIHHSVEHLEFNLFTLTEIEFQLLWLCLRVENLLDGLPLKIKEESLLREEDITKHLYKDYAAFRNDLWQNMVNNNTKDDKLLLFKKTQKLLDRYLFIFFAEDSGLLPTNSISRIVERWEILKREDAYKPLYDIFKQYFGYIDKGRKGQKLNDDIYAYNGGLFEPDEVLDNITLDDEILYSHVMKLTKYDFQSEVDVNILGHIFENSLNDIEHVTAQIKGEELDKSKTKRKKDGVFYTPKYITKYIVDNTIGKLCNEQKEELGIFDEDYSKGRKNRKKEIIKGLDEKLQAYRNWLLNISICDPACGSGAFLNQALEFLIEEHSYIDELESQLLGHDFEFPGVENHILEKNIFGVDLNDESVEIAKLSLWLRTAQRGRKLTSLNNNIKCGNSLIDDPKIAGDKAFNWQKEFPTVFKEKDKKAFHITTATHDSRTSQRMIDYKVRELRDNGLRPKAQPIWLELDDEILISNTIAEIIKDDNLNVMAYNICGDHLHLLLVCEENQVSKIVGKIKAKTALEYNTKHGITTRGHVPLSKEEKKSYNSLWTQKFGCKEINDEKQLWNTVEYIRTNREKHELPPLQSNTTNNNNTNKRIRPLVLEDNDLFYCSYEHAFRTEYKGGFDVVIGNPPYVQLQKIKEVSDQLKNMEYQTFESTGDLYCLFYEKGNIILKKGGVLGFITSNKWMRANYGKSLRNYFLGNTTPYQLIDLGAGIFEAAVVDSNIILFKKKKSNNINIPSLDISHEKIVFDFEIYHNQFVEIQPKYDDVWTISSKVEQSLKTKIENDGIPLLDWELEIKYGIKTGLNEAFVINNEKRKQLIAEHSKSEEIIVPILRGRDVNRYKIDYQNLFLINTHNGYGKTPRIIIDNFPAIKKHLDEYEPQLSKRYDKGETPYNLRNCAYIDAFKEKKIIWKEMSSQPPFVIDKSGYYTNDTITFIIGSDLEYLLCLLNSKLIFHIYSKYYSGGGLGSNGVRFKKDFLSDLPLKKLKNEQQQPFIEKSNLILNHNQDFQKNINSFLELLSTKFNLNNLSTKLENWNELEFGEFISELEKARKQAATAVTTTRGHVPLSLQEQAEWMQYFNEQKQKAQTIKSEINRIDKEIDEMVYELYGLTKEEIKIVENT